MELLLNEQTKRDLYRYLRSSHGPLILYGKKGRGQIAAAKMIAEKLLLGKYPSLEEHPDYYEVTPENGMIRIGQIALLHQWCRYAKADEKKVILILNAELMNVNSQNSLLKLLEDGTESHTVIMVSSHPLLETIQSRCQAILFQKPSKQQIKDYLNKIAPQLDDQEKNTLKLLADGSYETIQELVPPYAPKRKTECQTDDSPVHPRNSEQTKKADFLSWMQVYFQSLCTFEKGREILESLHAIQEKDHKYIYDVLKEEDALMVFLEANLSYFSNTLYGKIGAIEMEPHTKLTADKFHINELCNIIERISNGICQLKRKKFTRNNFFQILQAITGGK